VSRVTTLGELARAIAHEVNNHLCNRQQCRDHVSYLRRNRLTWEARDAKRDIVADGGGRANHPRIRTMCNSAPNGAIEPECGDPGSCLADTHRLTQEAYAVLDCSGPRVPGDRVRFTGVLFLVNAAEPITAKETAAAGDIATILERCTHGVVRDTGLGSFRSPGDV